MHFGVIARGPQTRPGRNSLPFNRRLPQVYRYLCEAQAESVVQGPGARDAVLATVEAVLFAADEPLTTRRLAQAAGLADAAEARRQVRRLRELYEEGGSAFQVEEVAGGYQLLTRPQFHPWLARLPPVRQRAAPIRSGPRDAGHHRLPAADCAGRHRGHPRGAV